MGRKELKGGQVQLNGNTLQQPRTHKYRLYSYTSGSNGNKNRNMLKISHQIVCASMHDCMRASSQIDIDSSTEASDDVHV